MLHIPTLWYYSPQMYWWRDYPFQLLQRFLLRWNIIIHFRALKHTFIWRRNGHSHTLLEMEALLSLNQLSLKYHSQAFKISPQCLSQIIDQDTNFLLKGNLFLSLLFNLLVLKPEYFRRTRPIPWLLMHWQLTNRVVRSSATTCTVEYARLKWVFVFHGEDFNYLCHLNVERWYNIKLIHSFLLSRMNSNGSGYSVAWFSQRCVMILVFSFSWWRHQMDTLSALLALCVGNSPVTGEFPAHRLVTRSLGAFFERLSKQS